MDFNADLHKILSENETHMYIENGKLNFFVFIEFSALEEFTNVLNYSNFEEEGILSHLQYDSLAIELRDLFEYNGYRLKDYKYCFNEDCFNEYQDKIKEFDGES